MIEGLVIVAAAFAAGVLNAIAGGGSFLTLPALVFAGVPPIVANATGTLAVTPGYLGGVVGFRRELAQQPRARLVQQAAICGVGGAAGAALLLVTPATVFAAVVPWLLLFATALFATGPWWRRRTALRRAGRTERTASASTSSALQHLLLLAVAVYGGYFNGGLGILLMALHGATGVGSVHVANALKNFNSLVLSAVSIVAFAWAGAIAWPQGLAMAVAATMGGYAGARLARRLPERAVQAIVVATGLVMAAAFFARGAG